MLKPKEKSRNSFIIEFKVYEDEEKGLEETIENGKKQIEEKKYEIELKEEGYENITKMVFAFKRQRCKNRRLCVGNKLKLGYKLKVCTAIAIKYIFF